MQKERMKESIKIAVDERIGNYILLRNLGMGKIELDYNPLQSRNDPKFVNFTTEKRGIVYDINPKRLKKFAEKLEQFANEKGRSFGKKYIKDIKLSEQYLKSVKREVEGEELTPDKNRLILQLYHDLISDNSCTLISIHKILIDDSNQEKELGRMVENIFIIKEKDSYSERIRFEFEGLTDQFISNIKNEKVRKIGQDKNIFYTLAISFLEILEQYGEKYSFEKAKRERSSIFGLNSWEPIRWLTKDLRKIYEISLKTHNAEIIRDVAYLPIQIAARSIEYGDHYIFQEYIQFQFLLYYYSKNEENKDLKNLMIDLSWRWLKELVLFYLEPKLEREDNSFEELEGVKDYIIHIFYIFQILLKESFEKSDFDSFMLFKEALESILKRYKPSSSVRNKRNLEQYLKYKKLSKSEIKKFQEEYNKQELLESIENEINTRKQQLFFGLSSYIYEQLKKDKNNETIKKIYHEISRGLPSSIKDFTEIFLKSHKFEVSDFWGWDYWYIEKEGVVHTIPILENLENFYIVRSLQIFENIPENRITNIKLPTNMDFALQIGGSRDLMNCLNNIEGNPDEWSYILSEESINKIPQFKQILLEAKNEQEETELKEKRNQRLSLDKINQFKNDFVKSFKENSIARNFFKFYNLYIDSTESVELSRKELFGIKIIEDKGPFIDEPHCIYPEWGSQFGYSFARDENYKIMNLILSYCKQEKFKSVKESIKKISKVNDAIVIVDSKIYFNLFEYDKNFKAVFESKINQTEDLRNFKGEYQLENNLRIPIFRYNFGKEDKMFIVLHKKRLGKLIQYPPVFQESEIKFMKDIFFMKIDSFTENSKMMDDLLDESLDWLKEKGNIDKQKLYLETKVQIEIFEKFEFEKHQYFEGFLFKIEDDKLSGK